MPGRRETKVTGETCIRLLPYSVIKYISSLLDIDNKWERLVVKIPRRLTDVGDPDAEPRYSHLQTRLFENTGRRGDRSPTQAIIDDWSTQNTKVKHLISVLIEAALFEAADYLSVDVLHGDKVPRIPSSGTNPALPGPVWEPDNKPKKLSEVDKMSGIGDSPYSRLTNETSGSPYSKLNGPEIVYNRIPSYDSQPSVPLKEPNGIAEEGMRDYESADTVQIRNFEVSPAKHDGPVENTDWHFKEGQTRTANMTDDITALKANREPLVPNRECENVKIREPLVPNTAGTPEKVKIREPSEDDEISNDKSDVNDIYSLIGSQEINFELLQLITDSFDCSRLIGSGGFGDVFLGMFKNGYRVAIKKLKKMEEAAAEIEKQFRTELDSLIAYRHKNIVRLYGYSVDGPGKCLVYEYLCNGSLEDRLKRLDKTPPLSNPCRVTILQGTADGIAFLNQQGIIHRDIKSANVLLDENFLPKVGDFATARGGPRGNNTMAMSTQVVIGTSAYLAPEAMHFDVSTKLDSYSFGIVILEVLTALPPLDQTREEKDLKSHIEENGVDELKDTSGGEWTPKTLQMLMEVSEKCTVHSKKRRCNVEDILSTLLSILC